MTELEYVLYTAPILTAIFQDEDIMVAVTDTSKYLYYSRSLTLDAGIVVGQHFLENDLFGLIMKHQKKVEQISPPDYGPPFRAIGYPIFSRDQMVIGGLGFGISLGKEIFTLNAIEAVRSLVKTQSESIIGKVKDLNEMVMQLPRLTSSIPDVRENDHSTDADKMRSSTIRAMNEEVLSRIKITEKEIEILQWINEGLTYSEISKQMSLSTQTVKNYISVIYSKLGARNKIDAINIANRLGIIR